jgi:hypothetical protein
MSSSLAAVVLSQSLAQAVRLHPYDGIRVLIKGILPTEHVERNRVFLDLIGFAGQLLFAEIRKEMSKSRGTNEEL